MSTMNLISCGNDCFHKKALRPNGEIYLIEYRGEDENIPIKRLHKMTEKQAVKEMKAAGMELRKNINNLPWQHCMIFVKVSLKLTFIPHHKCKKWQENSK